MEVILLIKIDRRNEVHGKLGEAKALGMRLDPGKICAGLVRNPFPRSTYSFLVKLVCCQSPRNDADTRTGSDQAPSFYKPLFWPSRASTLFDSVESLVYLNKFVYSGPIQRESSFAFHLSWNEPMRR